MHIRRWGCARQRNSACKALQQDQQEGQAHSGAGQAAGEGGVRVDRASQTVVRGVEPF